MIHRGKEPRRRNAASRLTVVAALLLLTMGLSVVFNDRAPAANSAAAPPALPTRVPTAAALATLTPTMPPTLTVPATATGSPTDTATPAASATTAPTATHSPTPTRTAPLSTSAGKAGPTRALDMLAEGEIAATPVWSATPLPLPTPTGTFSFTVKVPILMYHYISSPPPDADRYRVDLSLEPARFREQLQYLADNDFTPIDFYTLSRAITGHEALPLKPVLITIDDGYIDAYTEAYPLLREFGFTATVFVVTEFIDHGNPNYVSWDMVIEMAQAGIRFEPHSKTHIDLRNQDRATLIYQLLGSLQSVEARTGYRPRYFAYPSGRYDDAVLEIVRELEFWGAVTTMGGKWHGFADRYEWRRLRIRYNTSLAEFIDLVEPGDARYGRSPGAAPTATPGP